MRLRSRCLLAGGGAALAYHVVFGWGPVAAAPQPAPASVPTPSAAAVPLNPEREAYFGDLHLHTTNSYDAYLLLGTRTDPDQAFRFARGETIDYLGQPVRRDEPLDFMAVTDHSENLGVFNELDDPKSELSLTEIGKLAKQGGYQNFTKLLRELGAHAFLGNNAKAVSASAWQRSIAAANANYRPGTFTSFIGYEWTSMPDSQNLHRNVIFRGDKAPAPFSRFDSEDPAALWAWLRPRLKLRFFGGWNLPADLLAKPGGVKLAYARGVPMGSDLPLAAGGRPSFAVQAVKDPNSGNLDRIQIVKVWLENGAHKERVFDVAWSGGRRVDPATGKLAPVGNTVDLATGRYTNSIGAAELATLWTDPSFRRDQAAVYYVRVLEIPTPRLTTLRALEYGLPLPKDAPATIQERAWSSPIWYTPPTRG